MSDSQTLHAAESIHYIAKAQRLLICNCIESKYIVHYILNLDLKHLPFVLVYPLGKDSNQMLTIGAINAPDVFQHFGTCTSIEHLKTTRSFNINKKWFAL